MARTMRQALPTRSKRSGYGVPVGRHQRQEWRAAALFLAPFFVVYALFLLYPLVQVFRLSFFSWDLLSPPQYIGLANYTHLFGSDRFWQDLLHTIYFAVLTVPPALVLGLLLALALNSYFHGRNLLRAIFFAPYILPISAVTLVWTWLLQPQFGFVNQVLAALHLPVIAWLSSTLWAMPAVAVTSLWWTLGFSFVLFLAGLQGISRQYYEAAEIDGAGRWQMFRHITLPLLRGTTEVVSLLQVVAALQIFAQVYLMTGGGPVYSTEVVLQYMYDRAFSNNHIGYASAIAVVFLLIILLFSILQARIAFSRTKA